MLNILNLSVQFVFSFALEFPMRKVQETKLGLDMNWHPSDSGLCG